MGQFVDPSKYGQWVEVASDPLTKKTTYVYEDENVVVFNTVTDVEELVEENKASFNGSEGKRWGDGKVVARIDLPTYYNKIVPAKQNGDDAWIKRFLNDGDNRAYRTFKGKI